MENKNGQGIFYGVIGVATLVVAIIGATFAYFGASTNAGGDTIQGTTLGGGDSVLSLTVDQVTFDGTTNVNPNLVPTNLTSATIANGLTNKCVGTENYTGCHVYRIVATSTDNVPTAAMTANLTVTAKNTAANDLEKWHYAFFDGTVNTAGTGSSVTGTPTSSAFAAGTNGVSTASNVAFWNGALNEDNSKTVTRYLIVWLEDTPEVQQDKKDANDATASYTGVISLSAGTAGKIQATFTAATNQP